MSGTILGAQDLSFPAMQEKLKEYTDIVMSDPAVASMSANTGGGSENTGRMNVDLKPICGAKDHGGPSDRAPAAETCGGPGGDAILQGESGH